jgi:hypothetical protein
MAGKRKPARDAETWLALGAASQIVGVDPDTLRRWADEGRVEVYLTPGGHRRFERGSLQRLVRSPSTERSRISRLGAPERRLVAAYRRNYRSGADRAMAEFNAINGADREVFRTAGRLLVRDLVASLDTDGEEHDEALGSASARSAKLGTHMATSRASLTESVSLFVVARQPFMTELAALAKRRALDSRQVAELLGEASAALDQCLLSFIQGHQRDA